MNLNDSLYSYDDFSHLLHNELRDELAKWKTAATPTQNPEFNLFFAQKCIDSNRAWKTLEKIHNGLFKVNAVPKTTDLNGEFSQFVTSLERYFNQRSVETLMEDSCFSGTLKMSRPALYVFPSLQGDSAFFSVDGFTALIDGGYSRAHPSFWKFVSRVKQVDSVVLTRTDSDALGGLQALFAKKLATIDDLESQPAILSVLGNLVASPANSETKTDSDFILEAIEKLRIKLVPLVKSTDNLIINAALAKQAHNLNKYEHVNLFYKLGYGSLDLYVLSPFQQSAEFKEFCTQQQGHFARNQNLKQVYKNIPSSHLASSVCLLVWLPMHRAPIDGSAPLTAVRLLFTGNVPQGILLHSLEKLKDFELLNVPTYRVRQHQQQVRVGFL